jgi:hypothetical protein
MLVYIALSQNYEHRDPWSWLPADIN